MLQKQQLAKLVTYIFETQRKSEQSVVFRLADLANIYEKNCQNSVLLLHMYTLRALYDRQVFAEMQEEKETRIKGRYVLLMFEKR